MRITQTPLSQVQKTPPTGKAINDLEESVCELATSTDDQMTVIEEGMCEQADVTANAILALEDRIAALEAAVKKGE